jgi:hypothetical protein
MYASVWVPNKSATKADSKSDEFHVGPHIMIVSPRQYQDELRPLSHDGSNGMPYVAHVPNGGSLSCDAVPAVGRHFPSRL